VDFTSYLLCRGKAANTVRVYVAHVTRAETWMVAQGVTLDTATAQHVVDYTATLAWSNSTRGQFRSALTHWFQWRGVHGPDRAVRVPPQPEMVCRALEDDEAVALVKAAVGWYPHGLMVLLGLYLALRRQEIAVAEWDRYEPGWYRVTGKGERTATLPVHPVLAGELDGVPRRSPWVFPGRYQGDHCAAATVGVYIDQVAAYAGIGHVQPHRLRHTALATANDRLGDLRAVQTFARHTRPDTTAGYTRTRRQRLRDVSDALDYLT